MKDIAVYGIGGFGREVLTLIQNINRQKRQFNIIGFFDDGYPKGQIVNGFPILGNMDDLCAWKKNICVVIAVGNPMTKKKIVDRIKNENVEFPTLIHPNVVIGDNNFVKIGRGGIICAGNIITTNIEIKDFVILNLGCTVGHDTVIGNYASFMPSVNISGEVNVSDLVYVGTGAKLINQLGIGEGATIGAGAVVVGDIPAHCTAVGVPARVIKKE